MHDHEMCEPQEEEEDLDTVVLALESLDGSEVARFIRRYPERLFWNPERGSVQLWGCGETISVSILMTDEQIPALTAQ